MMKDELPEFIRQRRLELKLSAPKLAERISLNGYDVGTMAVRHWENGRRRVSLDDPVLLDALAAALNVDRLTLFNKRGIDIASVGRSPEARLASEIIDGLPPDERPTAIEYLRVLERKYPKNGRHE